MHVVFDLLFLVPGSTGGRETYARELLPRLRAVRPDWRFSALLPREAAGGGWWSECCDEAVVLPRVSGSQRLRWALGELLEVPRAARGADVVHALGNFGPVWGGSPRVVTVHDVIWKRLPDTVPAAVRLPTTALVGGAARRAARVLTPSQASREDIVALLGVDPDRIRVVPNGIAAPREGNAERGRVRAGATGDEGIALCVASDVGHKNLDALAAAAPAIPARVVFAGHGTERLGGLGAVSADDLEDLYAAAAVVVLPTRYEGFGLPVGEALARGIPVACSDLGVLREVGGGTLFTFDPSDPSSIARGVTEALDAPLDQARLRAQVSGFTWDRAASAVAATYEELGA